MKISFSALALAAALLLSSANAHVQLKSPVPYRTSTQAPQSAAQQDFDMKSPLDPSGNNFPCKGYHKDKQGTQSLVEWAAGSSQTMQFDGSATHGGGSCQASLSEDGGATWKVMKSFIGGCPNKDASFTVPKEAKAGPAIFGWTWFNQQGNREMYMNCAAVTITGGGSGLSTYPDMFTANIGKDCKTAPGDLAFPNPGQNVEGSGGIPPTGGACGATGSQPPAGSSPSSAPAGGSPSSAPAGGSPSSAPAGGSPSSAPAGGSPTSAPAGGSPTSAPAGGSPTKSVPSSSSVPGGPGGVKPNPSPTSSSVPKVTPPAPTPSSPVATGSSSPSGTTKAPAQSPSKTAGSPAATGTGAPAPSYPGPAPSTAPSPSSKPSTGGACVEGAITCNADGTWSQCGSGVNQNMGKPAPGTACANGRMQAIKNKRSIRFSSEHMARNA